MINKFFSLSIIIFFVFACSKDSKNDDFYGNYKVKGFVSLPVSALSDSECAIFKNQEITLTKEFFAYKNDTCKGIKFKIDTIKTNDYFGNIKVEIENKIGIVMHQTLIGRGIYCKGKPWETFPSHLIEADKNHLLAEKDGVFFILERI